MKKSIIFTLFLSLIVLSDRILGQGIEKEKYLGETTILNYFHPAIQSLISEKGWAEMDTIERVKNIYDYVRDEIRFGYNVKDEIPASEVLKNGYGQCNTKATLLMALLRATGVPNRIHGFTIDKALQKGAIKGLWFKMSPNNILHSWVEVFVNGEWYVLEGVILDKDYLTALHALHINSPSSFCGYGAYTEDFHNPSIDWNLNHTFIQEKGINQDFGLFDTPDEFYARHSQKLNAPKRFIFKNYVRHRMNRNVNKIRNQINQ